MLTIGQFSRLCLATRKTLRHYDAIGLLRPLREANGYRYYDPCQLEDMRLIYRLKSYGFSLPEIAAILARRDDMAFLAERLSEKEAELATQLQDMHMRLAQLTRDAQAARKGIDIMQSYPDVQTKRFEPVTIFSIRRTINVQDFGSSIGEVFQKAGQAGLPATGPAIAIYHGEDFDPEHADVELCAVVQGEGEGTRLLDPGLCAYVRYVGPYDSAYSEQYTRIAQWISENGYTISGPPMDIYLRSVNERALGAAQYETEICFPIARQA